MSSERVGVFEIERPRPGQDLLFWPTQKFKTVAIRLALLEDLDEQAPGRALLAGMLRRGTRRWPDMMLLSRRLEELFGASLSIDVVKSGERHDTVLRMEVLHDRFVGVLTGGQGPSLLADALDLMVEVLVDPHLEGGAFPARAFEQERQNLVHLIESVLDDKIAYAQQRLLEEMYPDEPYGRPENGTVDAARALRPAAVLAQHRARLETAPIEVYVVGDLGERERAVVREAFARLPAPAATKRPRGESFRPAGPQRRVVERLPLAQSKLHVGHRLDLRGLPADELYATRLFNAVLGGSSTSKLFKEVREKHGLAYYAHSQLDRLKGHLTLAAGVSAKNADRALDVMRAQLDAVRRGEFESEELENARLALLDALKGVADSAFAMADFVASARAAGRPPDPAAVAAVFRALTKDDVVAAAQRPVEEVVYLLEGTEDDGTPTAP